MSTTPSNRLPGDPRPKPTTPAPTQEDEKGAPTIVAFIEARLDEDEAIARTASFNGRHPEWEYGYLVSERFDYESTTRDVRVVEDQDDPDWEPWDAARVTLDSEGLSDSVLPGAGPHIARHDPARALREVEAKRAILAEHPLEMHHFYPDIDDLVCARCVKEWEAFCCDEPVHYRIACPTLMALAAVYSDHPDFDPAWAVAA